MCYMPWDVACRHMGMFKALNPTEILLEDYAERKESRFGFSFSILTTGNCL